jgi:hypothetical protein
MAPNRIDVEKSSSHHVSQGEIGSDKPCSRQLSEKVRLAQILSGLLPSVPSSRHDQSGPDGTHLPR